jgi:hypothetical protein
MSLVQSHTSRGPWTSSWCSPEGSGTRWPRRTPRGTSRGSASAGGPVELLREMEKRWLIHETKRLQGSGGRRPGPVTAPERPDARQLQPIAGPAGRPIAGPAGRPAAPEPQRAGRREVQPMHRRGVSGLQYNQDRLPDLHEGLATYSRSTRSKTPLARHMAPWVG